MVLELYLLVDGYELIQQPQVLSNATPPCLKLDMLNVSDQLHSHRTRFIVVVIHIVAS